MTTEDYVSFETAKLLKEKGFDWEVHRSYLVNDNFFAPSDVNDLPNRKDAIRIPTLQMAMKWLREVHGLHVDIDPLEGNWCTKIVELEDLCEVDRGISLYGTYEEACEAGIKYCLENLI